MSAIVSFLNESVIESFKGAYKLRKSYQLLHKLFDMIVLVESTTPVDSNEGTTQVVASPRESSEDSEDDFVDATDDFADSVDPTAKATDGMKISDRASQSESIPLTARTTDLSDTRPSSSPTTPAKPSHSPIIDRRASIATISTLYDIPSPPSDMTITDQSIYAGTLMALGSIMLLVSLLPPSLSTLLSIIGFRGSRSQALSMLWKVSSTQSPFAALATFGLGSYYGSIVQNSDIVSDEFSTRKGESGGIIDRLQLTILDVRKRYPGSALWVVEEVHHPRLEIANNKARMESVKGNLEEVVCRLSSIDINSQMPQIDSLVIFESALYT